MQMPSEDNNNFINLKDFLKDSKLLTPYKEELGTYYGEQFLRAVDLWNEGKADEALPLFDECYELFPNFFIHRFIRLGERMKNEDPADLLKELDEINEQKFVENLDKFLYHVARASLYFLQLDTRNCINTCNKSLKFVNNFSPVYIMLGDALMLELRYAEAVGKYKIALKADYKILNVKTNLAYAYLCLKKNRKALKLFKEVAPYFPENFKIQYNMALCYLRHREFNLALEYLDKVENLNPTYSGIYLTRGGVYLKQKKFDDARREFETAKNLGSKNAENLLKQDLEKLKDLSSFKGKMAELFRRLFQ